MRCSRRSPSASNINVGLTSAAATASVVILRVNQPPLWYLLPASSSTGCTLVAKMSGARVQALNLSAAATAVASFSLADPDVGNHTMTMSAVVAQGNLSLCTGPAVLAGMAERMLAWVTSPASVAAMGALNAPSVSFRAT